MNIPDEALESAAMAIYMVNTHDGSTFELDDYRQDARAALEAAAPHMLAGCWDDAYEKGRDRGEWEAAPVTEEPKHTNPYRPTP